MTALWLLGSFAVASEPGDDALKFLDHLSAGKVELEVANATAMTEFTGVTKRKELARRLETWRGELRGQRDIEEVRVDGNLAAVLVRQQSNGKQLRLFGLAMVKHGDVWRASPTQCSFENTLAGYAEEQDRRRDVLERWMLSEQHSRVDKLREKAREELNRKIAAAAGSETFAKSTPAQAIDAFAAACEKGDVPTALAWLGGGVDPLPDEWDSTVDLTTRKLEGTLEESGLWKLLRDPAVVRTVVDEETGDQGQVGVAFLDPHGLLDPTVVRIHVLYFHVFREKGRLRIELPELLTSAEEDRERLAMEQDMVERFPESWRKAHPEKPAASAEELGAAILEAINAPTPAGLLDLMDKRGRFARGGCERIARLWAHLQPRAEVNLVPVDLRKDGNVAYWALGYISLRTPTALNFAVLRMRKTDAGWLVDADDESEAGIEEARKAGEWQARNEDGWSHRMRNQMFASAVVLPKEIPVGAPEEDAARKVAREWREAMVKGDWKALMASGALLSDPESRRRAWAAMVPLMLSAKTNGAGEIHSVTKGERWTVVRVDAIVEGKKEHTMLAVANTTSGPRVVAEVDLVAGEPTSRGRKFLNDQVLGRIAAGMDEPSQTELKTLFAKHSEQIEKETKEAGK